MAPPKGSPKRGGRQKGTPNKKKVFRLTDAATILRDAGLHPIKELIKIIPQCQPKDQARFWLELFSYVSPKPRELAQEPADLIPDETESMTDAQLLELVKTEQVS